MPLADSHRPESMLPPSYSWGRLHVILEDANEGNMVSNDGKLETINKGTNDTLLPILQLASLTV